MNDLGYCDVFNHRMVMTDNIPVKDPHRRIPPHRWNEVREYKRKLNLIMKLTMTIVP